MTGIYCIEGSWLRNPRRQLSVEPVLSILRSGSKIPYVHRDVSTDGELAFHLHEWSSKAYASYPYLYLAVHGNHGKISSRRLKNVRYDKVELGLDWLAGVLEDRCDGRVIMFASCSTLRIHGAHLTKFHEVTGVRAVLGYKDDVEWLDAAAFELALFSMLPRQRRLKSASILKSIREVRTRHKETTKRLQFRASVML